MSEGRKGMNAMGLRIRGAVLAAMAAAVALGAPPPAAAGLVPWSLSEADQAPLGQEQHPEIVAAVGRVYRDQGNLQLAEQAFRRALQANPVDAEAYNNLGVVLERQGKLDEALQCFEKAIERRPNYRLAHFHIGRILVNRREYTEAIEHFKKTLTPEDDYTPTYLYALAAT